jgi:iron complex outermembrane receptor protein
MKIPIRMRIILLLSAIISSATIFAQSTVSGKVTDNSGKGIGSASVTATGGRGTQTNVDGNYSLSLPNGNITITVSYVGFMTISKVVVVSGNMTVDFVLGESSGELGEIILTTGARSLPRSSTI